MIWVEKKKKKHSCSDERLITRYNSSSPTAWALLLWQPSLPLKPHLKIVRTCRTVTFFGFTLKAIIHTSITNSFTKMYCQPQSTHNLSSFTPSLWMIICLISYIWSWLYADKLSSDESRGNILRLTTLLSGGNLDSRSAAGKTFAETGETVPDCLACTHRECWVESSGY